MGHLEVQPPPVSVGRTVKNFCRAEFVKSEIPLLGFIAVLAKATDYNYLPLPVVAYFFDWREADCIFPVTCSCDGAAGKKERGKKR